MVFFAINFIERGDLDSCVFRVSNDACGLAISRSHVVCCKRCFTMRKQVVSGCKNRFASSKEREIQRIAQCPHPLYDSGRSGAKVGFRPVQVKEAIARAAAP